MSLFDAMSHEGLKACPAYLELMSASIIANCIAFSAGMLAKSSSSFRVLSALDRLSFVSVFPSAVERNRK